jgi:hypothetical protein
MENLKTTDEIDSIAALTSEHERQCKADALLVFSDESGQQRWHDLRRRCQQQEHAAHAAVDGRQRYAYAIQTNAAMDFAADVAEKIQIGLPEAGSSSSDNEKLTAAQLTPELVRRVLIDVMEYQRYSDIDPDTCDMGFNMLALAGWKYSEELHAALDRLAAEETTERIAS